VALQLLHFSHVARLKEAELAVVVVNQVVTALIFEHAMTRRL
jgi:hypothetical protein